MLGLVLGLALADTCEEASKRYQGCVRELLGEELPASEEGLAACRADEQTVAMYTECLPAEGCSAFMTCLTDYAEKTRPSSVPENGSRDVQCAAHVQDGLQGIGFQLMLTEREDPDPGRKCVMEAGATGFRDCLEPAELELLNQYEAQRLADCAAWDEPLAKCILGLEGAVDCSPDEYPFWRLPIRTGTPGPAVVWTTTVREREYEEPGLAWTVDGGLLITDADSVRRVQDGEVVWSTPDPPERTWVSEGALVATGEGLPLIDVRNGRVRKLLKDAKVDGLGPAADAGLLAVTDEGVLYRLPAGCVRRRCLSKLGVIDDDYVVWFPRLFEAGSVIAMGDLEWFQAYATEGLEPVFDMIVQEYGGEELVAAGGNIAVVDDAGVALLDPEGCAKNGRELYMTSTRAKLSALKPDSLPTEDCPECVHLTSACRVASRGAGLAVVFEPTAAGDGVAFNDHGLIEQTHLLLPDDAGWRVKTGGQGFVATDDEHVYTVSTGLDGEGPVKVLALALEDGSVAWETVLEGAGLEQDEYTDHAVAVRGKWLAARVGDDVFVLAL